MVQGLETYSHLPGLVVLLPIIFTALIGFFQKRSFLLRNWLFIGGVSLTFALMAGMGFYVFQGKTLVINYLVAMYPFTITFRVDTLSFLVGVVAAGVWLLCSIYSLQYMKDDHAPSRYFPAHIFTMAGALGVFLAGNLYTFFLFYELMAFSGYLFVIHAETPEAFKAGSRYLMVTILSGILVFTGVIITYQLAGTLDLGSLGIIPEANILSLIAFIAFIIGFGFKAGLFPLHTWLPAAHPVAPSPASALLSGILIKSGAYGIIRVTYNVYGLEMMENTGWATILLVFAAITTLYGSLAALVQDNLKRRLAYSSISQIGYILMGGALLTERGLAGDVFHIVSHATIKSTLFLAAGAIITKTGIKYVSQMAGVGRKMPYTMGAFTLAALAMIGIPPLNGFVSKWALALGALDAGQPGYAVVLLISSMLNALYYLPIVILAYFRKPEEGTVLYGDMLRYDEVRSSMLMPILILALSLVIFNVLPVNLPLVLAEFSAAALFQQ